MKNKFKLLFSILIVTGVLSGCNASDGGVGHDMTDNKSGSVTESEKAADDLDDAADKKTEKKVTENEKKPDISDIEEETVAESIEDIEETVEVIDNPVQRYSALSTWVAYWDYADAIDQVNALGDKLDTVVCFEALYGSDGRTIEHPEGCDDLLNLLKTNYGGRKAIYLSYTNDMKNPDGSYTQKSVDLLRAVFSSPAAMEQYSADMVKDAKASGVDGLELDYENMRKDESLFQGYAMFVDVLAKKCAESGLSFRVATEYQTGIKCVLPNGPEYVVMCYNLYGYGTAPGPKADAAYLASCYDNFAYLSHVNFAFSLGGFKWNNDNVTAVTENEALSYLAASGAALGYEPSGGAYFTVPEADGSLSTVYYADANTIRTWKNILSSKGANAFSLWRMGGNNTESLRLMRE